MAHIVCSAAGVEKAARAVISHVERERLRRDESAISANMMRKHFWTRKQYTRDDAINHLNGDFFGWRSTYAWRALEQANKLLLLAQHGDPVTIDEESAQVLWGQYLRN